MVNFGDMVRKRLHAFAEAYSVSLKCENFNMAIRCTLFTLQSLNFKQFNLNGSSSEIRLSNANQNI